MPPKKCHIQRCFRDHAVFKIFLVSFTCTANFVHPTNLRHSTPDPHFKGRISVYGFVNVQVSVAQRATNETAHLMVLFLTLDLISSSIISRIFFSNTCIERKR